MEKKQIEINGFQLAYEDHGSGDAVVLLHGFCGSSQYWQHIIPGLEVKYRVIAPDLRGHGQSAASEGIYRMETMADDIMRLLEKLQIDKAVLFGHSLGGYITLAFAEKYSSKLAAFALVHSTAYSDSEQAKENRLKGMEIIRNEGIAPFVEGLTTKLFSPANLTAMQTMVRAVREIGKQTNPQAAIHSLEGMRERPDRNHVLSDAKVPILLAAGNEDQIIPVERTLSVDAAHITKIIIENAGHLSMLEAPERLQDAMVNFLEKIY